MKFTSVICEECETGRVSPMVPIDSTSVDAPLYNGTDIPQIGKPGFLFRAIGWLKAKKPRKGAAAKVADTKQRKPLLSIFQDKDEPPNE